MNTKPTIRSAIFAWHCINKTRSILSVCLLLCLTPLASQAAFSYKGSPTVVITSGKVAETVEWTGWDWVWNPLASATIWSSSDLNFRYVNSSLVGLISTGVNLAAGGVGYRFTWAAVPVSNGTTLDIGLHFQHNLIFEHHYIAENVITGIPYHSFPNTDFYDLYKQTVGDLVDIDFYYEWADYPDISWLACLLQILYIESKGAFQQLIDDSWLSWGICGDYSNTEYFTTNDFYDIAENCSLWWLTWDL
jgi:hypothetical protein